MSEPVKVFASGTVKADGTFAIDVSPVALRSYYGMIMATCQQQAAMGVPVGSPTWTLLGGRIALDYDIGPTVDLGSRLFTPGELIGVHGTNGTPGATIAVTLHGVRSADYEELLSNSYSPVATSNAVTLGATPVYQGPLQGSPGGTVATLTLPAEATGMLVICTAVDANSHVKIVGLGSNTTYLDSPMTSVGQQLPAPSTGSFDPRDYGQNSIQVTVSNATSTNTALYFIVNGAVMPSNSPSIPLWVATAGFTVSIASQAPQTWQAATTTVYHELTAVGTFTLVPGVGSQIIRVFGYSLAFDSITGASIGFLQDDVRASPANRIAVHSASGTDTKDGNASPRPLPAGAGLVQNLASLAGAGTWRVAVAYSQGNP